MECGTCDRINFGRSFRSARPACRAGAVRRRPVEAVRRRGSSGATAQAEGASRPQETVDPQAARGRAAAHGQVRKARQTGWSRQASESPQAGSRQVVRSSQTAGSGQACALGQAQAADPHEARSEAPPRQRQEKPARSHRARTVDGQALRVAHAPTRRKLTCSIFGWRDEWVADFYAVAFGLQGRDWIVERSPKFLWLGEETPGEAYEAHEILVEALLRAGWRRVGNDGAWYRQRFERSIETSPERP